MKKITAILLFMFISSGLFAQGYQPTDKQKLTAEKLFRTFTYLVSEEQYDQAYALQTDSLKKKMTLQQWSEFEAQFRQRAGGNPQFGNIRATWYKDPADAEAPGLYVAFDYACRYENIDACSGVVMLHSTDGDNFNVLRNDRKSFYKETTVPSSAAQAASGTASDTSQRMQRVARQPTGPSASYAGRIVARIKPNINYAESLNDNPTADVEVRTSTDGTIISRTLVKSSGVKSWDEAVIKAIDKTETLPPDVDGRVIPWLLLSFRPKG